MTHQILKSKLPADFIEQVANFAAEMDFWAEREKIVTEENKKPLGPRPLWGDFAGKRDPAAEFSVEMAKWEAEKLKRHAPVKKPIASPDVVASVQLVGDHHVADFEVVNDDPTPEQVLRTKKDALIHRVHQDEEAAKRRVALPLGKLRLAALREHDYLAIAEEDRTPDQIAHIDAQAAISSKMDAIYRVGAEATSEIEDLTADNIDSFVLPTFD